MKIEFGDDYRIVSDKHQYMMQERRGSYANKATGEPTESWDTWGYYRTLESLMRSLPDAVVRRSKGTLGEGIAEAKAMTESLLTALREAGYQPEPTGNSR